MVEVEELVSLIVTELVDRPDCFDVTTFEADGVFTINVDVTKDQIGKVIGRQGRIAKSIRTLVRAYGMKNNLRIMLEINELNEN